MVQEDAPRNHDDWNPWNPENLEGDDEDQFPEEVGPPENMQLMLQIQDLAMALPRKLLFF